jgi:hypothetical protein
VVLSHKKTATNIPEGVSHEKEAERMSRTRKTREKEGERAKKSEKQNHKIHNNKQKTVFFLVHTFVLQLKSSMYQMLDEDLAFHVCH